MTKLNKTAYLVLEPTINWYTKKPDGFRVVKQTTGKPSLRSGEVAVKLNLSIDSGLFENYMPVVDVELENVIIEPTVEIDNPHA